MVLSGVLDFEAAKRAIDLDTILFLVGMMIVLANLELSGFFEILERRILGYARSARMLLLLVMSSAALLSALFMNDTICLLFTPVVVRVTKRLALPPVPYLIGLAVAANIGSTYDRGESAKRAHRSAIGFRSLAVRGGRSRCSGSAPQRSSSARRSGARSPHRVWQSRRRANRKHPSGG